jgi:hypothetical protein
MTAGYSGSPLAKKLGIKSGCRILLEGAPSNYAALVHPLPDDVRFIEKARGPVDLLHFFTTRRAELVKMLPKFRKQIEEDGMIWVSWPKKSAKVPSDLTEDIVRAEALRGELVDVKVCAVDDVWSGLKLVVRLKNRRKKIASGLGNR